MFNILIVCPRRTVVISQYDVQDYFTTEMAEEFFRRALAWQEENGYNVYHETHRKRFLHSPWVARSFMPKFPQMKVSDPHHDHDVTWWCQMVADLSHWVCVSETGPSDPDLTAVVEKLAGQMRHTHCRSESTRVHETSQNVKTLCRIFTQNLSIIYTFITLIHKTSILFV